MCKDIKSDIYTIYNRLQDELSKRIYADRLMFLLTRDKVFVRNMVSTFEAGKIFLDILFSSEKCKMIFGAGILGQDIAEAYGAHTFKCFVDNHKRGQLCGLPVISFQEYLEYSNDILIVISSRLYYQEMYQQLIDNGVPASNILCAGAINDNLAKAQYFDLDALKGTMNKDEIFIDGGCLDGASSIGFIDWCENRYRKVYAFEPDLKNYQKCVEVLQEKCEDKFEVIQQGMWKEESELHFTSLGNGGSSLDEDGEDVIQVTSIDKAIHDKVSFIKMDIEGAEYNALLGAQETIKKYKPKLAICIYHKPEDMWEIPMLILKINPEYKFYVRHYSISKSETVLYAI